MRRKKHVKKEYEGPLMTIEETAEYLNFSKIHLYRLVNAKKIPAFKIGASWRCDRNALDRWLETNCLSGGR